MLFLQPQRKIVSFVEIKKTIGKFAELVMIPVWIAMGYPTISVNVLVFKLQRRIHVSMILNYTLSPKNKKLVGKKLKQCSGVPMNFE